MQKARKIIRNTQAGIVLFLLVTTLGANAQTWTFAKDDVAYTLELPSSSWHAVPRLDTHDHLDFMYADDSLNGYLRLGKRFVIAGTEPADLIREDEKRELHFLPGYVACGKGESFTANLKGANFAYEFIRDGTAMYGRIYYLQVDSRTFYVLHFTVAANRLGNLRQEMDSIARSFRLK